MYNIKIDTRKGKTRFKTKWPQMIQAKVELAGNLKKILLGKFKLLFMNTSGPWTAPCIRFYRVKYLIRILRTTKYRLGNELSPRSLIPIEEDHPQALAYTN